MADTDTSSAVKTHVPHSFQWDNSNRGIVRFFYRVALQYKKKNFSPVYFEQLTLVFFSMVLVCYYLAGTEMEEKVICAMINFSQLHSETILRGVQTTAYCVGIL